MAPTPTLGGGMNMLELGRLIQRTRDPVLKARLEATLASEQRVFEARLLRAIAQDRQ